MRAKAGRRIASTGTRLAYLTQLLAHDARLGKKMRVIRYRQPAWHGGMVPTTVVIQKIAWQILPPVRTHSLNLPPLAIGTGLEGPGRPQVRRFLIGTAQILDETD
jgi:hypothetical protein